MMELYDLVVIGAGPAGISAALKASALGLHVALLDEQENPGGQIYRGVEHSSKSLKKLLGPEYEHGASLVESLKQSKVDCLAGASVWQLDKNLEIGLIQYDKARFIKADRIIIATGAMERPFPIPGWTLPGVMTAGAGQILLKSNAIKPAQSVVLAGCGPLLYLLAWQYLRAGVNIKALLDTTPKANYRSAAWRLPSSLSKPSYLLKGLSMLRDIRAAGMKHQKSVGGLRALGTDQLEAVEYEVDGNWRQLETGLCLLHQGVFPNVQMSRAAGCAHEWDEAQLCWKPVLDTWGNTDIEGIMVAGDNGGILGADAAELSGSLAAIECAYSLGRMDERLRNNEAAPLRKQLNREGKARRFLDALYRPLPQFRIPLDDNTVVCRCEEVSAGEIRKTVKLGCLGPNQLKSFCRAGMGPCQGRLCGITVSEIIAQERGVPIKEVGYYRVRPPLKPITLEQLAGAE